VHYILFMFYKLYSGSDPRDVVTMKGYSSQIQTRSTLRHRSLRNTTRVPKSEKGSPKLKFGRDKMPND